MAFCTSHPEVETARVCSRCQRPFCDRCLVDLVNQPHCAGCKQVTLTAMHGGQSPAGGRFGNQVDPERFVFWCRIYNWALAALSVPLLTAPLWYGWLLTTAGPGPPLPFPVWLIGTPYLVMGLIQLALHVTGAIGLSAGRVWSYYLQWGIAVLGLICGTNCLFLPIAAGVVMIVWLLKPEVKQYFGLLVFNPGSQQMPPPPMQPPDPPPAGPPPPSSPPPG